MAESFVERRRRELGLTSSTVTETKKQEDSPSSSFVERRKRELGLIKVDQIVEELPKFEPREINPVLEPAFDIRKSELVQKSQAPSISEPITKEKSWQDDPSRDLPVIGPLLKGLDWVANTPVAEKISEIGQTFYTPGAGVSAVNALTRGAESLVAKALPNLVNTTAGRVGSKALSEGIVGAPLGAAGAQIMNPDATTEDYVKGALFGGAAGGALGAVGVGLGALGRQAKGVFDDIRGPVVPATKEIAVDNFRTTNQRLDDFYSEMASKYGEGNTNSWSRTDNQRFKVIDRELDDAVSGLRKFDVSDTELFTRPAQREALALPPGRRDVRIEAARNRGAMPGNETVIPAADIPANALPAGNYQRPQRLRVNNNNETLDYVMQQIKDDVQQDMRDIPIYTKAVEAAAKRGYDLPKLLEGQGSKVSDKVTRNAQERVAGVYPTEAPNIARPASFNKQVVSEAAPIVTKVGARPSGTNPKVTITAPQRRFAPTEESVLRSPIQQSTAKPSSGRRADELLLSSREPQPSNRTEDLIQTQEPRLRDRIYNKLDEAEKSARARLAAKRNTLSSVPIDQWADHAIILAAQAGKGTIKLADATEFLVREFGEEIRPHVKSIVNRAKNIAKETERRASKEAEEARNFNAADAGDANTFRKKISRDISSDKTPFTQKWEKIKTQFVDDLAPLENLEKKVKGKLSSAEDSLYKSARLFRGVPEKANQIVKERLAPVVNDLEKKGYSSADLGDYALAVHARDVNARDIKSGFTNKEIDQVISKYANVPEMEAARKQLIQINDDLLQELKNTGVISEELLTTLRNRFPNYVPLFRAFDDQAVNFADGLSQALANVTVPIKGLKGSERKVVDPLENMVRNIFQSTNAAERNRVAQQLSKLADDELQSKIIRRLNDGEETGANTITRIEDGKRVSYEVEPLFIRKLNPGEEVGRKNVVNVLENGNKVQYEVEPEVYSAMLNLDKESSNTLIKILQKPASVLRAGATLTPEFSLRNPLRDIVQAFVTSNSGFNPFIDFPVGLIQSISKGDLYKQWVKELGAYGNIISNDRQVHREALERVLKEPAGKKFINIINPKSWLKVLRAITDTTESATKVGEFRAALRQGQTPQEAAYRSRDIMDFGRAGTSVREANKVVAFLNANIQGKSKLIRAFKANPAGFSARAFSAITVPTIGVFLMQKYMANPAQKQTIEEAPNWMKDTFWLVPIPGTDQVARVPKPFDLNVLFSNLPERAMNYVFNNDKQAMDGFLQRSLSGAALPTMISGLIPFIEGMADYSFFRQGNIIPQGENTREFKDQYDINTTETAKLLARGADAITGGQGSFKNFSSPRIMDNTIRGLTAGLGSYATSAIDVLLDKFNITDNPAKPAKLPSQQPLAKAFLVNPSQSGQSYDELYKLKDKLTREKGSANFNKTEFKNQTKLDFINEKTEDMKTITTQIREIQNSKSYTPSYKRDQIERLTKERNKIAQNAMKQLR